jgi:transient receptor potential cation channel subfamily V protein 6|eukprot:COSAG02_NODE_15194_length_1194_cov_2.420091_2_plen_113_part_00
MFFTVTADMSSFLVMIIIFIVGNGFALMLLFPTFLTTAPASEWSPLDPQGVSALVDTLPRALYTSFNMMMGDFDAEILNDAYMPRLAWPMFYLYVLVVNIVMLNLLIALVSL